MKSAQLQHALANNASKKTLMSFFDEDKLRASHQKCKSDLQVLEQKTKFDQLTAMAESSPIKEDELEAEFEKIMPVNRAVAIGKLLEDEISNLHGYLASFLSDEDSLSVAIMNPNTTNVQTMAMLGDKHKSFIQKAILQEAMLCEKIKQLFESKMTASTIVCKLVSDITAVQRNMQVVNRSVQEIRAVLAIFKERFWYLERIHFVPSAYLVALHEVARRSKNKVIFDSFISKVIEHLNKMRDEELTNRKVFGRYAGKYVPPELMPGLNEDAPLAKIEVSNVAETALPDVDIASVTPLHKANNLPGMDELRSLYEAPPLEQRLSNVSDSIFNTAPMPVISPLPTGLGFDSSFLKNVNEQFAQERESLNKHLQDLSSEKQNLEKQNAEVEGKRQDQQTKFLQEKQDLTQKYDDELRAQKSKVLTAETLANDFENQLKYMQQRNAQLQEEKNALSSANATLVDELKVQTEKASDYQQRLQAIATESAKQHAAMQTKVADLERQMNDFVAHTATLENVVQQAKHDHASVQSKLDDTNSLNKQHEAQIAQFKSQVVNLQQYVATLTASNKTLTDTNSQLDASNKSLKLENQSLQYQMTEQQKSHETILKDIINTKTQSTEQSLATVKKALADKESQLTNCTNENAALKKAKADAEKKVADVEKSVNLLKGELQYVKSENESIKQKLFESEEALKQKPILEKKVVELTATVSERNNKITEVYKDYGTLLTKHKDASDKLVASDKKYQELYAILAKYQAEDQTVNTQLASKNAAYLKLKAEYDMLAMSNNKLQQENAINEDRIKGFTKQLDDYGKVMSRMEIENERSTQVLFAYDALISETAYELQSLSSFLGLSNTFQQLEQTKKGIDYAKSIPTIIRDQIINPVYVKLNQQ